MTFTPARNAAPGPAPTLLMLHGITDNTNVTIRGYARYLVEHGFNAAEVSLPYHHQRRPKSVSRLKQIWEFAGPDLDADVESFLQAASDVSTVVDWLLLPDRISQVDPKRIGFVGYSLGAEVGHIAMAKDRRISAGVAIDGAGDFLRMYSNGQFYQMLRLIWRYPPKTDNAKIKLDAVDPVALARATPGPHHVFLIQSARDQVMAASASTELWRALGKPPIEWLDAGHLGTLLTPEPEMRDAVVYLNAIWSGRDVKPGEIRYTDAITIKIGLISGMDTVISPAVQWQALTVGKRPDHTSLFHGDLGVTLRGPFAGIGLTVTPAIDVGYGHMLFSSSAGIYVSLHTVL